MVSWHTLMKMWKNDYSPNPPLEQAYLSYKFWAANHPPAKRWLGIHNMRIRLCDVSTYLRRTHDVPIAPIAWRTHGTHGTHGMAQPWYPRHPRHPWYPYGPDIHIGLWAGTVIIVNSFINLLRRFSKRIFLFNS